VTPLQPKQAQIGCAVVVFIAALALYLWTLAPTVTLVDSGELIVAAHTLGVAHPPGLPLYLLIAHAATLLPLGNIATRVHLTSAVTAALAAALLTLAVAEALLAAPGVSSLSGQAEKGTARKKKPKGGEKIGAGADTVWIVVLPALVSGLLIAFSRTLWAYATIAEVYALNALLITVIFFLMLRWRRRIIQGRDQGRSNAWLYAAALVFGLAMGAHHVTVGLMLPALAVLVYSTEGFRFFKSKKFVYAALLAMSGLVAIYSYLPIAASRSPVVNWGNPRTVERIWWHITGRQYQVFFSFSLEQMLDQTGEWIKLTFREFGPWWLPIGLGLVVLGFMALYRGERKMFWFLMLVVVCDLIYALNYEIAEDKDAYYLPAFIAAAIAAGVGARWLIALSGARRWLAMAALVLVPVVALASNFSFNNRRQYFIAQDYVDNILNTVEPGGMLLTLDWQVYSPLLYIRQIEQRRRDVIAIDVNLLRRSWYFDYLKREYPELMGRTRDKVDVFLRDLLHWERDPEAFNRDITLVQQIDTHFYDMISAFVSTHIQSAPVYITQDIAVNLGGQDSKLTNWLMAAYQFVPHGLVFQVVTDREFHEPVEPRLWTRGLADGTLRFEDDDVVKLKVLPVYLNMLLNRGRYLAAFGHHQRAIEAAKQALALDPNFGLAHQLISQSTNALQQNQPK
jgi:tetratricopeptide (TPR) repeat protein